LLAKKEAPLSKGIEELKKQEYVAERSQAEGLIGQVSSQNLVKA